MIRIMFFEHEAKRVKSLRGGVLFVLVSSFSRKKMLSFRYSILTRPTHWDEKITIIRSYTQNLELRLAHSALTPIWYKKNFPHVTL